MTQPAQASIRIRITVLCVTTILLPGPHDLFQVILNGNRDILDLVAEQMTYYPESEVGRAASMQPVR